MNPSLLIPSPCTLDAIYLDAIDETMAGGYKCMHLASGNEITRHEVIPVPITPEVKKRVEALAKKEGIPTKLSFIFRHRGKFIDDPDALLAGVDTEEENEDKNEIDDEAEDYEEDNQDDIE